MTRTRGSAAASLSRIAGVASALPSLTRTQLELVVGDRGARARDELLDQLLLVEDGGDEAE